MNASSSGRPEQPAHRAERRDLVDLTGEPTDDRPEIVFTPLGEADLAPADAADAHRHPAPPSPASRTPAPLASQSPTSLGSQGQRTAARRPPMTRPPAPAPSSAASLEPSGPGQQPVRRTVDRDTESQPPGARQGDNPDRLSGTPQPRQTDQRDATGETGFPPDQPGFGSGGIGASPRAGRPAPALGRDLFGADEFEVDVVEVFADEHSDVGVSPDPDAPSLDRPSWATDRGEDLLDNDVSPDHPSRELPVAAPPATGPLADDNLAELPNFEPEPAHTATAGGPPGPRRRATDSMNVARRDDDHMAPPKLKGRSLFWRLALPGVLMSLGLIALAASSFRQGEQTSDRGRELLALRATSEEGRTASAALSNVDTQLRISTGDDSEALATLGKLTQDARNSLGDPESSWAESELTKSLSEERKDAIAAASIYLDEVDAFREAAEADPATQKPDTAPTLKNAEESFDALVTTSQNGAADKAAAFDNSIDWTARILPWAGIGLGVAGILLAILAALRPARRLTKITGIVGQLSNGDLDARSNVTGKDAIGRLGTGVDFLAERTDDHVWALTDDAQRGNQTRVVAEALELAHSEQEVFKVVERAMAMFARQTPMELLATSPSSPRLWRVANSPTAGPASCPVESPASCFAIRRGQTLVFDSAESINSCPKLKGRPLGDCGAVCVPVSFSGSSLGVLHAIGPAHEPPPAGLVDQLVNLAGKVGSRIETLRLLEHSRMQATTDGLTGLPNRRAVEEVGRDLIHDNTSFVLGLADIDHFKKINDSLGHEVGDRALQLFGNVLRDNVREADIISRFGGEEFVIVYPEMSVAESMEAIERIRHALSVTKEDPTVPAFTVSFGVTHSSVAENFDEILRIADAGLLTAKKMGRNRVVFADAGLANQVFAAGREAGSIDVVNSAGDHGAARLSSTRGDTP